MFAPFHARGQNWKTFLRNHAAEVSGVRACDFLQVTDLFFRPLFAFFIIELKSRKVIHLNVTRSPTDPWIAHQLREATPYGSTPKYLIRDNDRTFGPSFARMATTRDIKVLRKPYRTPKANAVCERFLGKVRRECLDHFLIFQEKQLYRLLKAYLVYFNQARPHQGLGQRIPDPPVPAPLPLNQVIATPVLGGLHHDYRKTAYLLESVHLKSKENRAAKLHRYVKLKAHGLFSVSFPSTNKDETPFFCLR